MNERLKHSRLKLVFCLLTLALLVAGGVLRPVHQFVQAQTPAANLSVFDQVGELRMALAEPSDLECCTAEAGKLPKHWRCMSDLGIFDAGADLRVPPGTQSLPPVIVRALAGCSGDILLRPPINA